MKLYSQRDPAYDRKKIGQSNLTVHGFGCFVVSIANLFQKQPETLLNVIGGYTPEGLLYAKVLAKECGGEYIGRATTGEGWQIAQTDHYQRQGYETHFFCVNLEKRQMIDPLKFPATVETLAFRIVNVRVFTGVKLDTSVTIPTGPFPDVGLERWSADAITFCKDEKFMQGYDDGTFKPTNPVSREEMAVVIERLYTALAKV